MRLGYERIVNDKQITIAVDESAEPWITLKVEGEPEVLRLKVSEDACDINSTINPAMQSDVKDIYTAVCHAYREALKPY